MEGNLYPKIEESLNSLVANNVEFKIKRTKDLSIGKNA